MTYKEYTNQERQILRIKLENAQNMAEFFSILDKEFDMETCKPSLITKKTFAASMVSMVLPMINPGKK